MEKENILTEEEIKDLTDVNHTESNVGPLKTVDFFNHTKIVKNEFSAINNIHDRFSKYVGQHLYKLLGKDIEINYSEMKVSSYKEVISRVAPPFSINVITMKPLRGNSLIVFDVNVVDLIINSYFGGHRLTGSTVREFTELDQRILEVTLQKIITELQTSWSSIYPLEIQLKNEQVHSQLNKIYSEDLMMMSLRFSISFGETKGDLVIAYPYIMLETIRNHLTDNSNRNLDEADPNWIRSLTKSLLNTELEISAIFAEKKLTLKDIIEMKPGMVIPIEKPNEHDVYVENILLFKCMHGASNDKNSIKILKIIK